MKPTYQGTALETGGTSMKFRGDISPAVRWLYQNGYINSGMQVLDYGAGKYDRNAKALREWGVDVWSFDPHHGSLYADGWNDVSSVIPEDTYFDLVYTSYVLNVVPDRVEDDILKNCDRFAPEQYHIVRNDIYKTVYHALHRQDKVVTDFFYREFDGEMPSAHHCYSQGTPPVYEVIEDFCYFGTRTSRGFQRIPQLKVKGFTPLRTLKNGYAIYAK